MLNVTYLNAETNEQNSALLLASESVSDHLMLGLGVHEQGFVLLGQTGRWYVLDAAKVLGQPLPEPNPNFSDQHLQHLLDQLLRVCHSPQTAPLIHTLIPSS